MIIVWQSILLLKKYTRKREGWGSRKTFRSFFVAFQGLSRPLSRGGKTRGHPSIALKQPIQSSAVSSRLLFNLPPGFLFSASPPPKSGVSFGFVGFFFFFFFLLLSLPQLFPHKKLANPAGSFFSAQPWVATWGRTPESAGATLPPWPR